MDEAVISRYLIVDSGLQLSVCSQISLMSGYLDHYISGMVEAVPKNDFDDVKKTLSFVAALAVFMPDDGVIAFTISIPQKKRKIFCLFENKAGRFVARSHFWNAEEFEKDPRLAVQKVSVSQKLDHISMVDCKKENGCNNGIEDLFKKYLETQDGFLTDFFIIGTDLIFVRAEKEMIRESFIRKVNEIKEFPAMYINKENLSGEFRFSFFCGCTIERISSMLSRMPDDDIEYIFENEGEVSVECPRCGKNYKIRKNEIKKN